MLHLPIERMAELVDGGMTAADREHLATCARCTTELAAYRRLVSLAADERRRIAPPLTDWESLSGRLRAEGLIAGSGGAVRRTSPARRWAGRAAGIAVLLTGGALLGRVSSGMPLGEALAVRAFFAPADSAGLSGAPVVSVSDGASRFRSNDDAIEQLEAAQRAYDEAAAYLAAHDTSSASDVADQYRTRLAALDGASRTFEAALTDAPRDPILNQYLLATMNAREATMRRLGTALPVSSRLGRF